MKTKKNSGNSHRIRYLVLGIGVALSLFLVIELAAVARPTHVVPAENRPIANLHDFNQALIDIAAAIKPTVVTVSTEKTLTMPANAYDFGSIFDFFQNPHGGQQQQPQQRQFHQYGLGSGVITSSDGYILTNAHVIDGADSIYVRTFDGNKHPVKVVGADTKTDIAVLKIDGDDYPSISMGNSDSLNVGELVLAIGSPMSENLAYTVTQGIISATGRSNVGLADYEDFIQTDAAINPGNSGGPLVNMDGRLIGINTAIVSQSGGSQGLGFAIPVNMATHVMNSLIKQGKVVRGWLGVAIQDINESIANAMGIKKTNGALVSEVVHDGPADKAGVQAGDIIQKMDGFDINNSSDLRNRVASTSPGTVVDLSIMRNGKQEDIKVKLAEASDNQLIAANPNSMMEGLGFAVKDITPDIRKYYGLADDTQGVAVTDIDQGSNAYAAGLREGDVITAVNRRKIDSVDGFTNEISMMKKGDTILLRVYRNGHSLFLAFQP